MAAVATSSAHIAVSIRGTGYPRWLRFWGGGREGRALWGMVRMASTRLPQQEGLQPAETSFSDWPGKKYFVARYWLSSETETWHGVKLGVPKFIKGKPSFRAGKIVLNVPTDWTYSPSLTSEEVVRSGHFVDPVVFDGQDVVFDTDGSGGPFSSDLRLSKCAMLLLLSMFPKRGNASQPNFEIRMGI